MPYLDINKINNLARSGYKRGITMLYARDKELIKKLQMNANGEYDRFTQGDVEYLIMTIKRCAMLESEANHD